MSIGNNIKKWREIRNLKQSELAALVGVSDKTVSSWEINRTEPKMGMVEKICVALKCKKTDIVGSDNSSDITTETYYLNDETRQIAQEVFENPELRTLFKVAKDIPPERLKAHIDFMKSLKDQEHKNYDEGC